MRVKEAVEIAKDYVLELFGGDGLAGLRLEEIERGEDGVWNVTVGFARPLALAGDEIRPDPQMGGYDRSRFGTVLGPRTYRVVRVHDDGEEMSVKIREGLG